MEPLRIGGVKVLDLKTLVDERGRFIKPVEHDFVGNGCPFGEIYVIVGAPNSVRGNHYHGTSTEWFCVVSGQGLLVLKKGELREELVLDGKRPRTVQIPPGVSHAIKNIGEESMILVVYWDRMYDPKNSDTYADNVLT